MLESCHYVATGYIYDRYADRFLLILHKKLGKWLPPGGHLVEGEEPHQGVLRELFEETGLSGRVINVLDTPDVGTPSVAQLPSPFCILREKIPSGSDREGEQHIHIDFVYVVEINLSEPLALCSEEVSLAKWVSSENMHLLDTFENVKQVCQAISFICKGT